jgi:hypothetical protein
VLNRGFEAAGAIRLNNVTGALQQKAIIFTESRRPQEYLFSLLQKTDCAGKVVLFNGTYTDSQSQAIYHAWMSTQEKRDQETSQPAVAIEDGMDRFKLNMDQSGFDEQRESRLRFMQEEFELPQALLEVRPVSVRFSIGDKRPPPCATPQSRSREAETFLVACRRILQLDTPLTGN